MARETGRLGAMRKVLLALAVLSAPLAADEPAKLVALAPSEIVAAAPQGDWVAIAASDLLVMDITPDAKGKLRRVVIQLMPAPFSQGWIGNIRKLAAAQWWDGLSVNRVQDNYVVQWGDAEAENKAKAKALPIGLAVVPEPEYQRSTSAGEPGSIIMWFPKKSIGDAYSDWANFEGGWPIANRIEAETRVLSRWPVHCYGMVGVGRDMPPDTGSGAELYVVIGHAPRHLDRNIALVGRVIEGIEHLSSLPRGTGPLGSYERAEERTVIRSIRLLSEMEIDPVPNYEYLSTESPSFAAYAEARANRRDPFFIRPAGGADVCNIPVPVRRAK
jgi:cyclophilin family peptidyl-prolyl cis-trans isomerase